jgi:Tfp pilus assembly protein PilO
MPRSFKLAGGSMKDPRVVMRVVIGVLLVANLAAAVAAFKPFGGSAADLESRRQSLVLQLTQLQARLARNRQLVEKVERARSEGDSFLGKYFTDTSTTGAMIVTELNHAANDAGIKMGQATWNREPIEGSDILEMLTTQVGFEGTYANFTKFVNLLDKSPRFMIIENLQAAAPQVQAQVQAGGRGATPPPATGQALNVTLKIDTFVRAAAGAEL